MPKYTVIAEYWDNGQIYVATVHADGVNHAIEQTQNEVSEEAQPYIPSQGDAGYPLNIKAVLKGWPEIVYTNQI